MIKLSNYINFMFTYMSFGEKTTDYPHHASMNYICSYDYQCNYHGFCDKQKSMGRCTCDFGYVGTYCQYPQDVYHIIRQATSTIIDTIYAQYGAKLGNLYQSEIMFISNVFNGLFVDPDSVPDEKYNILLAIMLGIANSPAYSIPTQTEDVRIVLDAMNRLGARIGLEGKKFRQNTGFETSQTLYGVDRNALIDSIQQQLQSAYLSYINTLYTFLQQASKRLNPSMTKVVYTSFNFDVSSEIGYASDFVNKEVNIQSNDAFWKIPANVFSNAMGWASQYQEIKLVLAKWILSPILFDYNQTNYLETNVTQLSFLNTASDIIQIQNLTENVQHKEPYRKMQSYSESNLKCKAWDKAQNKFTSEGCESFVANDTRLLCQT